MSASVTDLRTRFSRVVRTAEGDVLGGGGIVAATSGGLDSVVLLHLLRFGVSPSGGPIHVAHFDHGMRPSASSDADWVRGVARAWGLSVHVERAEERLRSEEEARDARYTFLESVRRKVGADVVATGHHADDQAETVLFRLLRGSGTVGLSGMASFLAPGLWRPLLPFWREELLEYADTAGLAWREDPSNAASDFARNVLRNRIIPDLEASVAPGARRSLVRLAEYAQDDVEVWSFLMPRLLEALDLQQAADTISLDREELCRLPSPLRGRVLRWLAETLDVRLDAVGTRSGAEFSSAGRSGRRLSLTAGLVLKRELGRIVLTREGEARRTGLRETGSRLEIPGAGAGSGSVTLAGRTVTVRWGGTELSATARDSVALRAPCFPLTVRGQEAGDRIQLPYGSKKLKKLLLEARIPSAARRRLPVLVDAHGEVLWIPGVATAVAHDAKEEGTGVLYVGVDDVPAL